MKDLPLQSEQYLGSAGGMKLLVLQPCYLLLVHKEDIDSFLELVDDCGLEELVGVVEGLARATPGGVDVQDHQFLIVLVEVLQEVLLVPDGDVEFHLLLHQLLFVIILNSNRSLINISGKRLLVYSSSQLSGSFVSLQKSVRNPEAFLLFLANLWSKKEQPVSRCLSLGANSMKHPAGSTYTCSMFSICSYPSAMAVSISSISVVLAYILN